MKHVRLIEARANIAALLDEVERGETLVIAPEFDERRKAASRKAMEELRELRKGNGRVTAEEILAWRDEGRR